MPPTEPATTEPVRVRFDGFGWRPLGRRQPVVSDLDLVIEPGERVLLAGPSGAGKSTLLLALVGALGETIAGDLSGSATADGRVGLLQQNPGDSLVAERIGRDIAFGPENVRMPRDEMWAAVDRERAAVGLPYDRDHPTSALSGGELQRLALAGALALRPGLLLLDEPTSMLDDQNAESVRSSVQRALDETGATAIIVEHQIERWLDLVDRVVVLGRSGELLADTSPDSFAVDFADRLGSEGVWMPGLATPEPRVVAADLVAPSKPVSQLRAENIRVELQRRGLRTSASTVAVDDVDVDCANGSLTALVGPSGAGKSTLLAVFAGLQEPTSGRIVGFDGQPHRLRSRELAALVGWVPQNAEHGLLAKTVADEVRLTAEAVGREVDVDAVLDVVGLGDRAGSQPFRLSGGEQRRLALAAALAHRPAVLCLDEPTVGQDRNTWAAVAGWATSAAANGAIVVTTTHDRLLAEAADQVVALDRGVRV